MQQGRGTRLYMRLSTNLGEEMGYQRTWGVKKQGGVITSARGRFGMRFCIVLHPNLILGWDTGKSVSVWATVLHKSK